jgi:hypothetical protein
MIGLEGCGKTVLATTLAKRLSTIDARGIFLNPQGVKTLRYIESVWATLQSGDWPPSTPPGELFELSWRFQIIGELDSEVKLVDTAGQDLRLLFGEERIQALDELPAHLKSLAQYCRSAEIILFLLNLKDYLGHGNPQIRVANEAAVKSAMDYLGSDSRRRVCLVFTQSDLYKALAEQSGGWLELAAAHVPYIFGAHLRMKQMAVYPVSAVADTRVEVDSDGKPRRVPLAGFRSEGIDELVAWLSTQLREANADRDREAAAMQQSSSRPPAFSAGLKLAALRSAFIRATANRHPQNTAVRQSRAPAAKLERTTSPDPRPIPWKKVAVSILSLMFGIALLMGYISALIAGSESKTPQITHIYDGAHAENGGDSAWTDVVNNSSDVKSVVVKATISDGVQTWVSEKAVTIVGHSQQHVDFWLPGADASSPYPEIEILGAGK